MKRSRFNEEQLIGISKEHAGGMPTAAVCRRHGISSATFHKLSTQPSFRAIFWEGGLGRLTLLDRKPPVVRYQRERPGELVHLDVEKLARFNRVGHRMTGSRRGQSSGVGWDFGHVAVDDASRLAYVEILEDERRTSTTGFLVRALRWFRARGIRVERGMTDNRSGYVAKLFGKACRLLRLRHLRTRPYTPKTNGKAERFIQTLLREWAYARPYRNADRRAAQLPRWLEFYNQKRPHAGLGGRIPATVLAPAT